MTPQLCDFKLFESQHFQGPIAKGTRAMSMFRRVASVTRSIGLLNAGVGENVFYAAADLAALQGGMQLAIDTLEGFTLNGLDINAKSWSDLFGEANHFLLPYVAAINVWMVSGFLGIPKSE